MKGIRPQLETGYLRSSDCHLEISVLFKKKKKLKTKMLAGHAQSTVSFLTGKLVGGIVIIC